jgi:type VI secretion system ImpM family protein
MPYADAAGFFGKLPGAGDFVQRRLPAAFVDRWDGHFEQAMAAVRGALGPAWQELFRAGPSWRFLLPPRVCGDAAWAGVMTPSADRVGRCFPLVLATRVAEAPGAGAWREGSGWYDLAERIAAAGRADAALGVEAFDEQVRTLPDLSDETAIPGREPPYEVDWSAADHWRFPLPRHADATPSLLGWWSRLAQLPAPWCLWWSTGGARVPASVLATRGLPQPAAYAGFIDATHAGAAWRAPDAFAPTEVHS